MSCLERKQSSLEQEAELPLMKAWRDPRPQRGQMDGFESLLNTPPLRPPPMTSLVWTGLHFLTYKGYNFHKTKNIEICALKMLKSLMIMTFFLHKDRSLANS